MQQHTRHEYIMQPRTSTGSRRDVTPKGREATPKCREATPKDGTTPDFSTTVDVANQAKQLLRFDRTIGIPTKRPSVAGLLPKPVFLEKRHGFSIYLVDDFKIQNSSHTNLEFSNWAIHEDFPRLVPKDQIWVSKNETPRDREFYLANAFRRIQSRNAGESVDRGYDVGLRIEEKLRKQMDHIEKHPGYLSEHPSRTPTATHAGIPNGIYVRKLGDYKGYAVWLVHTETVQDTYKTDWVDGGNNSVYHFIPPDELWLSDAMDPQDLKFVAWHEYVESWLMRHKGWTYDRAHRRASATEFEIRKELGYAK